MSLLKTIRAQLGLSGTASQNFTLDASPADGTMKLARGNAGATTQDIMTVNALGEVDFPQLAQSLGANGYKKLPGGLIIQWGKYAGSVAANGSSPAQSFPVAFPNAVLVAVIGENSTDISDSGFGWSYTANTSSITLYNGSASARSGATWIALGN